MATSKNSSKKRGVRGGLVAAALLVAASSAAQAETPLSTYQDKNGNILVRKLTCAQLAAAPQDDADALALWYSGWYNGHLKLHVANIHKLREGIHEVVAYCQANPATMVTDAIETYLKK